LEGENFPVPKKLFGGGKLQEGGVRKRWFGKKVVSEKVVLQKKNVGKRHFWKQVVLEKDGFGKRWF